MIEIYKLPDELHTSDGQETFKGGYRFITNGGTQMMTISDEDYDTIAAERSRVDQIGLLERLSPKGNSKTHWVHNCVLLSEFEKLIDQELDRLQPTEESTHE